MKTLKLAIKLFIALIVLVVVGIIVLLATIDPNDYKEDIVKAANDATGRELSIEGKIGWSFFPRLGFNIGNTKLSNAKGFQGDVFAEVEKIDVGLQIKPLFQGKVELDVLTLILKSFAYLRVQTWIVIIQM